MDSHVDRTSSVNRTTKPTAICLDVVNKYIIIANSLDKAN